MHASTGGRTTAAATCGAQREGWGRPLTDAVLLVPVQPVAGVAEALEATRRVLAALLTAAVVHAAFVHVWEMGNSRRSRHQRWASSL